VLSFFEIDLLQLAIDAGPDAHGIEGSD